MEMDIAVRRFWFLVVAFDLVGFKDGFGFLVPGLFQGFVEGEGGKCGAGGAVQGGAVIVEVEVESLDVFRAVGGKAVAGQKIRVLISREGQYDLEV